MRHLPRLVLTIYAASTAADPSYRQDQVQWGGTEPYYQEQAVKCLATLRAASWNAETEATLASHPFVEAAEDDTLSFEQLRRFAGEQRLLQRSDVWGCVELDAGRSVQFRAGRGRESRRRTGALPNAGSETF